MLSPQARIALKAAWAVFLFTCLALRFWILRKRFRTSASIASDVCVAAAWTVLVPTAGLLIYEDTKYLHWYNTPKSERVIFNHPLVQPDVRHVRFSPSFCCWDWLADWGIFQIHFAMVWLPRVERGGFFFRSLSHTPQIYLYLLGLWLLKVCNQLLLNVMERVQLTATYRRRSSVSILTFSRVGPAKRTDSIYMR